MEEALPDRTRKFVSSNQKHESKHQILASNQIQIKPRSTISTKGATKSKIECIEEPYQQKNPRAGSYEHQHSDKATDKQRPHP